MPAQLYWREMFNINYQGPINTAPATEISVVLTTLLIDRGGLSEFLAYLR